MLGRRGVLAGALGLAALSACEVDDLRPPEDQALPTPSSSGSVEAEPDADEELVGDVTFHSAATLVVVEAARRDFPRLRNRLQPLVRMHRAHLAVLPPDDGVAAHPPPSLGSTPAEALARVRQEEEALQGRCVAAATSAESGALARLLASMSASVAQHTAVLR